MPDRSCWLTSYIREEKGSNIWVDSSWKADTRGECCNELRCRLFMIKTTVSIFPTHNLEESPPSILYAGPLCRGAWSS